MPDAYRDRIGGHTAEIKKAIYDEAVEILEVWIGAPPSFSDLSDIVIYYLANRDPEVIVSAGKVYSVVKHSSDNDGRIECKGPWQGYTLRDKIAVDVVEVEVLDPDQQPEMDDTLTDAEKQRRREEWDSALRERDLYPLVSKWLEISLGYKNSSSAYANNRGGCKWQNPDVIALKVGSKLGLFSVELITAEVKPSDKDWQMWIFEAVAHRMFAERSYFIFRNNGRGVDRSIYAYAEKYKIGIAVIDIPDDKIGDLKKWNTLDESRRLEFVDAVTELVPAPYEQTSINDKLMFLERNGVREWEHIFGFGGDPD